MPRFADALQALLVAQCDVAAYDTPQDEDLRAAALNSPMFAEVVSIALRAGQLTPTEKTAGVMVAMFLFGFRIGAQLGMPQAETTEAVN